jgi:hypothetical protein
VCWQQPTARCSAAATTAPLVCGERRLRQRCGSSS